MSTARTEQIGDVLLIDGFVAYLKALVVADADTLEPVDITAVTPPNSDSADPAVLNQPRRLRPTSPTAVCGVGFRR